ncbi:hypothetical protein C7271_02180 [filamentous cyanobacterium CCP5]|nr:hypothetical protein C7271_02180 [filamentous cyanobacterium CCP5]
MLTVLTALAMASPLNPPPAYESAAESPPAILASDTTTRAQVVQQHDVRALPGRADSIPVFNSNSPELIQEAGILLSTLPPDGMANRDAHLNFPLNGRFDLFAHHVARGVNPNDRRTLFMGVLVYNPGDQPVTLRIQQGVTFLSQEAPFRDLPATMLNPNGTIFAGPGSRVTTDFLRGENQPQWPDQVTIPAGHVHLLMNLPIPLRRLSVPVDGSYPQGRMIPYPPNSSVTLLSNDPEAGKAALAPAGSSLPANGRTVLMHLESDGPVHMASLAMYAPQMGNGAERVPSLQEWIDLLKSGQMAGPRDVPPTNPETYRFGRFFYGRVAGVAEGSRWHGTLTNQDDSLLNIPAPGDALSYVISTVDHNTFGTNQVQSAPMLVRYSDTAYRAHGNYGMHYSLRLPLHNDTGSTQSVTLKLQTPLQNEENRNQLRFWRPPVDRIFFRGTIRLRYTSPIGVRQTRYVHLVQNQGQEGDPLLNLNLLAGERNDVEIDFIYPPDATPPQVLTVQTGRSYEHSVEAHQPTAPAVGQD